MKKNKHYALDSFDFFKKVCDLKKNKKGDATYKVRLNSYDALVKPTYDSYDNAFAAKQLASLPITTFHVATAENDLRSMYSYSNGKIKELKDYVLTDDDGRTHNTCLNCTMSEANTMDHFLPKTDYPQFAVHPKNLLPSCSACNSKKSVNWQIGNQTIFINHYLDDIPNIQYLFCEVIKTTKGFKVKFSVDNRNSMNINIFNLVDSHFSKLNICNRLNKYCNDEITDLIDEYLPYRNNFNAFKTHINNALVHHISSKGINHWKNILKSSLITSPIFESYLKSKYP